MQITRVLLFFSLVPLLLFAINPVGQRARFLRLVVFLGLSALITIALVTPDIWDQISQVLGLNSGTDFLLYLLTIMLLAHVGYTHRRIRQIDKAVSAIVRELAQVTPTNQNTGST